MCHCLVASSRSSRRLHPHRSSSYPLRDPLLKRQSRRVPDEVDIALDVERWFEEQGFRVETRATPDGVVVDLVGDVNPEVVLKQYASAPTAALAVLAAEQRWLVEEQGSGSVRGETYVAKAEERLRRALG